MGRTTEKRPPTPPPPTKIVPAPEQWPKYGEWTACRHCGFRFAYYNATRGLCKTVCFERPEIKCMYAPKVGPARRCKCGNRIRKRNKMCLKCYSEKRKADVKPKPAKIKLVKPPRLSKAKDDQDQRTEAELDALIESRRPTMPRSDEYEGYGEGKHAYRPGIKIWRSDKRRRGFGTMV